MLFLVVAGGCDWGEGSASAGQIEVFAGVALRAALEQARGRFEEERGIAVEVNYGGSGTMLSQMALARRGDVYLPASQDFMTLAQEQGVVAPESCRTIAYLVPVIMVAQGNPKEIGSLADLARPGVKMALGNPETVAAGSLARQILRQTGLEGAVAANLVTQTRNVEELVSLLVLGQVDAVIAWRVLAQGMSDRIMVVPIPSAQVPGLGEVSAAVSRYSRHPALAQRFVDFLASPAGREAFRQHGYLTDPPGADDMGRWRSRGEP